MSLLFSIFLIGVFVAEFTGTIFSGSIVSDTLALVASKKCELLPGNLRTEALDYSKKCYGTDPGQDDCNSYNQSIAYSETSEGKCPFVESLCAFKNESGFSFDTGLLDAKYLGINSATRFQFRQRSTCHPLKTDGINLKSILISHSAQQNIQVGNYVEPIMVPPILGKIQTT